MFAPSMTVLAALCILTLPAQAHEFWIEPDVYFVASGEPVQARFRNGQEFAGAALSFIPGRSERFDMVTVDGLVPVPARMGDNPAFAVENLPEGLLTILHETKDMSVTYREWEKWVGFVEHKAFDGVLEAHRARGLPEAGFREDYRRFAKALVAVGDGAGADAAHGLLTEFVAGANPYTDDLTGGLPVQILLDGVPKTDAQIEMFERAPDGEVAVTLHRADADGRAVLPVQPGHAYLLNSVAIRPVEPADGDGAVWRTLWAALTFAVPQE